MPHIIVTADQPADGGQPAIMLRERVSVSDFESPHFAAQLVERLGWAVGDADELNRRVPRRAAPGRARQRAIEAAETELASRQRAPRSAKVVTTAS